MVIPEIKVKISDIEFNTQSIAELLYHDFSEKNKTLPFKKRVCHAFPQLASIINNQMTNQEIYDVVKRMMYKEYEKNADEMEERRVELLSKLEVFQSAIIPKMLDLFEVDWPKEQQNITCYLGLYAVFPRNVLTKEYWIHYKTAEDVIMRASVHEINHFILFEKWKAMHGYTLQEAPSYPDVLWFLEEMAVDPTLNTKEMQEVAPYPQKAYQIFYDNTLNDIPIEEYIIKLFKERNNMADFLDKAYKFIEDNHRDIIR
ncbi:hypothetical protein KQI61_02850 [Anaerocolumna aminovalerica]|uniref:hypothetical protein n=1 Tax=Anaerocolumna aminovalerica TaxID=1527 RepID=UPI001C0EF659|nr:hypothetical protein [Anaerocolumna aminovalerica]MBU5331122.1 hypothetical protein [Anaerocolumna aminovalerica]